MSGQEKHGVILLAAAIMPRKASVFPHADAVLPPITTLGFPISDSLPLPGQGPGLQGAGQGVQALAGIRACTKEKLPEVLRLSPVCFGCSLEGVGRKGSEHQGFSPGTSHLSDVPLVVLSAPPP